MTAQVPAEPGPDAFVFGDPPRPPRAPRRQKGEHELAVLRTLKSLPEDLRKGGIAISALGQARRIDAGMTDRDDTGARRELRMHLNDLAAMAPGERPGEITDQLRERREQRLAAGAE